MRIRYIAAALALSISLHATTSIAQDTTRTQAPRAQDSARAPAPRVVVTGQVRLRSEWDDRHVLADRRANVHLLRSRLRATAHPLAWITVVGEVQDARFLGESNPADGRGTTDASAPQLDMHQAYAQLDSVLHLPLRLRFGRQEMTFANERLIGVSSWSNTGRAFDGARATWRATRTVRVDAWAHRLSASSVAALGAQNFYGAWATWRPVRTLAADVFALRDDNTARIRLGTDAGRRVLGRSTLGANLRGTVGRVGIELEGAGQTGRGAASDSVARQEIRAFMGSVTADYALVPRTQTRLGGVFTVLSGDRSPADGRDERFSTLFGTNHRLYGTADIVPELSGTRGLVDAGVTLAHAPIPALRLLLEGHHFLPHRGDGAFGSEADLTATWRAAPPFELSGGASAFAPGTLLEERLGDGTRFWAYIQGTFDF
jgi:hypothetical protein